MKHLVTLNRYFWKYKRLFGWGILFVIVSNLLAVLPARLVRYSIDLITESVKTMRLLPEGTPTRNLAETQLAHYLFVFAAITLGLALLRGIFMYFMRQTIIVMSRWIEYDLRNELYGKFQTLGAEFYRRYTTGDLMARISEDVGRVRMYVGPAYMYGINMIVLVSLTVAAMLQVNWKLTLFVLAPLPLLAFGVYYVNGIVMRRSERLQARLSDMTTYAQEAYSGIRVVKTFGREQAFSGRFNEVIEKYRAEGLGLARVDAFFQPLTLFIIGLSTLVAVLLGGMQVINGSLTIGNIAEFVIYVTLLTWPVMSIGWVAGMVQRAAASQSRINALLFEDSGPDMQSGLPIELKGQIELRNVSFQYPGGNTPVLQNVSLKLGAGQTLGIVGRTGSGKSTLVHLLVRTYDATAGQVLLDGKNLTDLHLGQVREQVGYVPQEVFLFSESIADNIAFGKADATQEEIITAARKADVHKDIEHFSHGYQTLLGERGVTLSGGQKQRVAIARALIKMPRLFIFDDSLAAVDTETERAILSSLMAATEAITTIIVSHRVSAVLHADKIIYMEHGQIVEEGTHEELVRLGGRYATLYNTQLEVEAREQRRHAKAKAMESNGLN